MLNNEIEIYIDRMLYEVKLVLLISLPKNMPHYIVDVSSTLGNGEKSEIVASRFIVKILFVWELFSFNFFFFLKTEMTIEDLRHTCACITWHLRTVSLSVGYLDKEIDWEIS